jgi:GNAT superfamily N-acetyltransferase
MSHVRTVYAGLTSPARLVLRLVSAGADNHDNSAETQVCGAASSSVQGREDIFDIRPIRPADAELIVAALEYTSDETYYRRFHTAKHHFSPKELKYLTDVDGKTHIALVAVERGEHPRLAAAARFFTDPKNPLEGELAICVHDPFRRKGLGAEMLGRLHDEASSRGITQLRAMVQCDNVPMRELLYHVFPDTRVDGRDGSEVDYLAPVKPAVSAAEVQVA